MHVKRYTSVFSYCACTAVQNIVVNRHCQCEDIFLCPHDGDSGYGVFISDFDGAWQVERGRKKLERTKLHGRPTKYCVYGTVDYRPPEVDAGRIVTTQSCIYVQYDECSKLSSV